MIANPTWGANFQRLVDYLIENRDHQVLHFSGVSSVENAAQEMEAVAALNSRAKNKLMHLSLSAAIEDGQLSKKQWLKIVERQQRALGLIGHPFVVVRHRDTDHDHVHVFWSTISPKTGKTPPKMWFLRKGCATENIGPQALTADQVKRIPEAHRARRTFDFRALARMQDICRQVEREFGLRQLDTPQQAKAKRLQAVERQSSPEQEWRSERTGSVPLIERAAEIRRALNSDTWQARSDGLTAIRLGLSPVIRDTKKGPQLRGLTIFDLKDHGNRTAASDFDTSQQNFGLGALEKRTLGGTPSLQAWWPQREITLHSECNAPSDSRSELKQDFDQAKAQHKLDEEDRRLQMAELDRRQRRERLAKQHALMKRRKAEASKLPPSERREFYSSYSREVRARELADLAKRHRAERLPLRRKKMPTWHQFITARAVAGCRKASSVLPAMRPIQPDKKSASPVAPRKQLTVPKKQRSEDQQPASQTAARPPRSKKQPFPPRRNQIDTEMPEHLAVHWQSQKGGKGMS